VAQRSDRALVYFRPSGNEQEAQLRDAKRGARSTVFPSLVSRYLTHRSQLNRDAHFLSGMLTVISVTHNELRDSLIGAGVKILRNAYQNLALNPTPEFEDIRKIRAVRAAIFKYASSVEKAVRPACESKRRGIHKKVIPA
jgi:hypothetical protein